MLCPCHSGKKYSDCCQPLHAGAPAATPLALMRSRYAAYALGLVDYVIKTQRPENRESRATLEQFCRETEFRGLEILEVGEKTVTFKALLFQNGKDCSFTEKSLFEKSGSTWIFIAPSSTA